MVNMLINKAKYTLHILHEQMKAQTPPLPAGFLEIHELDENQSDEVEMKRR